MGSWTGGQMDRLSDIQCMHRQFGMVRLVKRSPSIEGLLIEMDGRKDRQTDGRTDEWKEGRTNNREIDG